MFNLMLVSLAAFCFKLLPAVAEPREMFKCVSPDDGSSLLMVFVGGEFERAVHRGITEVEMPITLTWAKDRLWTRETKIPHRFRIYRTDLFDNSGSEIWLGPLGERLPLEFVRRGGSPCVKYLVGSRVVSQRIFDCQPFAPR